MTAPASSNAPSVPHRGEVWLADLNPTMGREQAGRRPVLIVSVDSYNRGPADLVIALPVTSNVRPVLTRVRLQPPEGGLKVVSDVLCDQIRALSRARMLRRWGMVTPATLDAVAQALRDLMQL